jgi:Predicted thioesterase involved in non-ribosomal peptide biosynthesis
MKDEDINMSKEKLYYFPYAGASTATFKNWNSYFGDDITFEVLDYPGHGKRVFEDYCNSVHEICDDIYSVIRKNYEEGQKYYFAGHCLGGLIIYELCQMIQDKHEMEMPNMIFASGHGAPDKVVNEGIAKMDDMTMLEYLNKQGAVDSALLDDDFRELVTDIVIPPIRKDAEVYENYTINSNYKIPKVNLSVLYGTSDWKSPMEEIQRWKDFVDGIVELYPFNGGHYFINSMTEEYLSLIKKLIIQNR